jgi:ABC-2 family transporter
VTWLAWRQLRTPVAATVPVLAVILAALAATGPHLADLYNAAGLGSCVRSGGCGPAQRIFADDVKADGSYALLYFAAIAALYLLPTVIGMFWGAPLLAREVDAGTLRLTWTQGVTRRRWLTVKLALGGLAATALTATLSIAVTWWAAPFDQAAALPGADQGLRLPNRFNQLIFGAHDIVPIGYAAFAFALGVGVGMLVRRTLPAMALTLAALVVVQVAVPVAVRAHYQPPALTTTTLALTADSPQRLRIDGTRLSISAPVDIPGAWVTAVRTVDAAGQTTVEAPAACLSAASTFNDCDRAITALHLRQIVTYQPADRYWTFQWIETGLYTLLAAGLAALGLWRVRRLRLS